MVLPILPLYAQREFDLSPEIITLLVSAFFAAQFIAGPFIGRLSDRVGRLPVLIISQIGTVIAFAMLGLAESFEMLFLARILDGITGGNIIVAQAYITDITPKSQRTQALGYIFAAFGLGFVVGPAVGGVLSAAFGTRLPFLIASIAALLTVLLTLFALEESLSPEQREANRNVKGASLRPMDIFTNAPLMLILLVAFVGQFAFGLLQSTFALYGEAVLFVGAEERLTNLGVGLLLAVVGLGQFMTQMVILPRLLTRYSDPVIVIIGVVIRGFSTFLFVVITSPWLGGIAGALFAIGSGLMMPPLQSLSTNTVGDELRGGVLGVYQSSISLATIFSTALAGTLFALSPIVPYQVGTILFAVTLIPAFFLYRWTQQREKRKNEELVAV